MSESKMLVILNNQTFILLGEHFYLIFALFESYKIHRKNVRMDRIHKHSLLFSL